MSVRRVHVLERRQRVELPAARAFELYGDARRLERITPPWLRFRVVTPGPIAMRVGTLIDYRLRLHGVPIRWRTRIELWEPPARFRDVQLRGPYALWEHTHSFEPAGERVVVIGDRVRYALPLGALGALAHALFVRRDLEQIFDYRRAALPALLGQGGVTAIVWYRRDLRVRDHPALRAALDAHERVVPVFCLDDRLLHGRHRSGPRTQFLLECLADLDRSLRERGSGLVIRHGPPDRELPALAAELGAAELHLSADVSPFARTRGERARRALAAAGVELHAHPGLGAIDDLGGPRTQAGKPYTVFSPFYRSWLELERRDVLAAPRRLPPLPSGLAKGRLPSLAALGLEQEVAEPPRGGEPEARRRLERFLAGDVADYGTTHDALGADRTSRLSPYLHLGCVSAREVERRLPGGQGPAAFRRQLCWRDFYHHVLLHHPRNARSEFQARYRGRIRWSRAERRLDAWRDGRTGFPLVDAGMRQLRREGWMHNRARLVVGSFLTKDLGIDWRQGERWFMRLLVDGDEANNNGNWQWIASVGTDPQPAFRRIYNPARQMERFDPHGDYVRRYVPELADVPDEYLREPWTMPEALQREVGCVIGSDYPEPIVDHAEARRAALERYRVSTI